VRKAVHVPISAVRGLFVLAHSNIKRGMIVKDSFALTNAHSPFFANFAKMGFASPNPWLRRNIVVTKSKRITVTKQRVLNRTLLRHHPPFGVVSLACNFTTAFASSWSVSLVVFLKLGLYIYYIFGKRFSSLYKGYENFVLNTKI